MPTIINTDEAFGNPFNQSMLQHTKLKYDTIAYNLYTYINPKYWNIKHSLYLFMTVSQ